MREIVFDVETTGLDSSDDRIIEIGAVELENLAPTGREFHRFVNPGKDISPGAMRVHGITNEFVRGKPPFLQIVNDFLDFVGDARLVAHNASFDVAFVNAELKRCGHRPLRNEIVDTLPLAREVKRGGKHNLDALCAHFGIDKSKRSKHGALLDSRLLADVYQGLRGGTQLGFDLSLPEPEAAPGAEVIPFRPTRKFPASAEEIALHEEFVATLTNPIWAEYGVGTKACSVA